jgi:hypothetical protein
MTVHSGRSRDLMSSNNSDMLAVALDAAGRGWDVFPLRPGDKRPALHGAGQCRRTGPCTDGHAGWEQRATTDPARIRACWSTGAYNVGIACGPSGLVVVDLDTRKPGAVPPAGWEATDVDDGRDAFTVACERAGQPMPVDTHTVSTASGGTHLYYRHPAGEPLLRNTSGRLGWLIDTRAHGGYVVAAGSSVNGHPYTVALDVEPASLPDWLAESLAPQPLPLRAPVAVDLGNGRRAAYLRAAIDGQVRTVASAPQGQRNRALYLSAVALGQLAAGGELTETEVTGLLTQAAHVSGLRPHETARTIASGLRAGKARPRTLTGVAA